MIITLNVILCLVAVIYMFNKYMKRKVRVNAFEYYDPIMVVFDRARDMGYNKVFRDHAMGDITSGFKVNTKDSHVLQKIYIEIVFVYCGNHIIDDLISIHGNLDSITAYLASDLMKRLGDDEVVMKEHTIQSKENK